MQEVRRAIERVDNPDGVGFALYATLFSLDGMIGLVLVNAVDGSLFGSDIGFTNEIVMALLLDIEFLETSHLLDEDRAGAPGRHYRDVQ